MKRELARIVDQLSCIRSESSRLTHTESAPDILCHKLSLASEHAGNSPASLRPSFVKPFLQLLKKQAPSSVKQGILSFPSICPFLYGKKIHTLHVTIYLPLLAFLEALPHLCLHINLFDGDSDSQSVISTLIGLMEDPDPAVRIRLSQSIRFLLPETTGHSEQSSLSEVSHPSGHS